MLNDKNFLNIAYELATASKCVSRQTGSVIVKWGRIVSTGYNGTPAWYENCRDHFNGEYTKDHHDWSYKYEIHAEMNAIVWAAREGISIQGATIYCTYEPCFDCTRAIIAAGLKRIVFREKYKHHEGTEVSDFVKANGAVIEQVGKE
jgi:dCMP deaminase